MEKGNTRKDGAGENSNTEDISGTIVKKKVKSHSVRYSKKSRKAVLQNARDSKKRKVETGPDADVAISEQNESDDKLPSTSNAKAGANAILATPTSKPASSNSTLLLLLLLLLLLVRLLVHLTLILSSLVLYQLQKGNYSYFVIQRRQRRHRKRRKKNLPMPRQIHSRVHSFMNLKMTMW